MNKIQKIGAVLAVVALTAATQVSAMTVTWSAQVSRFLTEETGVTGIPSGGLLQLGVLLTSEATMLANQDNGAFIDANFNTWATGLIGDGTGVDGSFALSSTAAGAGFFSTKLYILAYSTAGIPVAGDYVGLYSSTDAGWISPASDAADPGGIELSNESLYAIIGGLSTGTVTSPGDIAGADAAQLHLIPVPEPSSLVLVGLGVLGMVGLVRRRS